MYGLNLNRETRALALAHGFSKCGEFAFETAFAVAVVTLADADLLLIGVSYFFRYIPSLVFSPLGGWLADNGEKKCTLLAADLAKSIVGLVFFAVYSAYGVSTYYLPLVIGLAMIITALDCLHAPTFRAFFPEFVEKESLASINSGLQVIEDAASIIGPLIFSLFVLFLSREATFLFFTGCLSFSAFCIAGFKASEPCARQTFHGGAMIRDAVCNVRKLKTFNAPLFAVISCTTVCAMFATAVLRFVLPASVLEQFDSEAAVGYVFALLAAGTVLGGVLYIRFNKCTTSQLVLRYWVLYGALFFTAAVALQFNSWLFLLILFVVGFIGAFVDIAIVTNVQCLSNDHEVGRNFSLYYFSAVMGDAVSGLVASLVFVIAGPATLIWMTLMLFITPMPWALAGRAREAIEKSSAKRPS